ncbi:PREDICTED: pentatricopeptide repeat-containing protein At2g29760, chloroplastic-like [Lupinus angustifolius]|uniref:pentatricopeptide repeat-containing protein At2g29760, chloroplastic-like n=1 Tax=Lupinus angustifolius TaxID=3871 RepID=UPI00092E9C46|nr:PREDICTED: pentatricopeptide repeat-containing protein At2g29760, chloroplastic-like [Lupinus angustifolius]
MVVVMMTTPSTLPSKTPTPITSIPYFPSNPKSIILYQCKTLMDLNQVHAHLIKTRLIHSPAVAGNLLESAALILPDAMDYALSVFRSIPQPNPPAYNIIIRGLTLHHSPREAILLFKHMCQENVVSPDDFTFCAVFKACSRLRALLEAQQVHAKAVKCGLMSSELVENTLIHVYAACDAVEVARRVFDKMPERGIVAWNAMLAGYAKSGCWDEVVGLFLRMKEPRGVNVNDVRFDDVSLIIALSACGRLANLELGEWIGEYIEANGRSRNLTLMTSLLDMYGKCSNVDKARVVFDQLERRDVVAWSAMISGYSQANRCSEALDLFHEMQKANVEPNEVTMVSVLYSCGVLGAMETGKWVHFYVRRKKLKLTVTLGTALIDFYAKCGSVESAIEVFEKMPVKNVFSWTAIIHGLASNGEGKRALELFHLMKEANIEPNDVTFIGVLSACSHVGLVKEGRAVFLSMSKDFGIKPRIEHYGCMVDILGRAGFLDEAFQFIKDMPIEPNVVVWRTLLASCRAHKNVLVGEESFRRITELEPAHSGDYILLSNIYALVGRSEDALRVRSQMREMGIKKSPGCTMIELEGVVHEFFSEDDEHSHSKEIYMATEEMIRRIKSVGYEPNIADARIDAEEEDKVVSVSHHSEKLAIAFGLIKTKAGATIRLSKNLRVCTDCHNATKLISKVYNRKIIVRDRNRFHHFQNGSCSCNDFW